MNKQWIRSLAGIAICIMTALAARAADITVAFVTPSEGKTVSVEESQVLWKSPFGGWGITAWPFSLRVDDTPILEYSSAEQKLLDKGMEGGKVGSSGGSAMEDALGKTFGGAKEARADDLMVFRLDRLASATLNLSAGRHVIQPFGLEFTVAADGTPATRDTRLRIDAKARRVEVVCHPVVVKMVAGKRSVSGPLQFSCASKTLLGGLSNLFDEYDKQNMAAPGTAAKAGFRRVTLYLPPSVPGAAYEVNGVKFDLDTQGRIKLAAAAGARCPDGREIYVEIGRAHV